ncbi:endonuclease G [Paraburkholderia steynii]|uniref:Endonuclease G n=1 Tax=Paraburkholderia steynii TaxID=1245441 RepID=A0A7Z7BKN1_9BURK|nr:DNA-binding protein [Paraburkholderia steynii]SDJ47353.1 endonuclease G [Paraburkholderia steynii]
MRVVLPLAVSLFFLSSAFGGEAQTISSQLAHSHTGEFVKVCGTIASAKYAASSRGQSTFLDFDSPYPSQPFMAVIWGDARVAFGNPEVTYLGHSVCVSGTITTYRGKPEMILNNPKQLSEN